MNLLYSNDRPGTYPPSYYAATANIPPSRPPLEDEISADVAIVGGGYTGLSAALHLAEVGLQVVLLDAHRPGWGASDETVANSEPGYVLIRWNLKRVSGWIVLVRSGIFPKAPKRLPKILSSDTL